MKNYNNLKFQLQERDDTQAQIFSLFKARFFAQRWKVNLVFH